MAGFDITTAEGSDRVCYILLPEGAVADMARWAGKASSRFNTNGAGMYLKEFTIVN